MSLFNSIKGWKFVVQGFLRDPLIQFTNEKFCRNYGFDFMADSFMQTDT